MFLRIQSKIKRGVSLGGLLLFFCLLAPLAFAANSPPQVGTIQPSSGVSNPNQEVIFTTTFSDPDGWQDIQYVYFFMGSSSSDRNSFSFCYNQNTNRLYLGSTPQISSGRFNFRNTILGRLFPPRLSLGALWRGGFSFQPAGFSPGSGNVIENTYAKLDCAKTTVSFQGITLTIEWSITFKPTFLGVKNIYLYVKDDANVASGWLQKGTHRIVDISPPQITSITPRDSSTFYEQDPIVITAQVKDAHPSLEYQFSIDENIKQPWSKQSSYTWEVTESGFHNIKVEIRDPGGVDVKEVEVYVFRKPIEPPNYNK